MLPTKFNHTLKSSNQRTTIFLLQAGVYRSEQCPGCSVHCVYKWASFIIASFVGLLTLQFLI